MDARSDAAALRTCARLAGRARDGDDGALARLVHALDPLHPLPVGGRRGPGAPPVTPSVASRGSPSVASPVASAWDAVGDLLVVASSAGLGRAERRRTAGELARVLDDLADHLGAPDPAGAGHRVADRDEVDLPP